jgi:hypothetical protein
MHCSAGPEIGSGLLDIAASALTHICCRVYNGDAFQRCKPFSMNRFGGRFLPTSPVAASIIEVLGVMIRAAGPAPA